MATFVAGEGQRSINGIISDHHTKKLTDLPTELLEHILCFPVLKHVDICNVSCCCKRLHDVCHGRGKVWGHQYKLRCYDFYLCISSQFGPLLAFCHSLPKHRSRYFFTLVFCADVNCLLSIKRWVRLLRAHRQLSAADILLMHQIHHQAKCQGSTLQNYEPCKCYWLNLSQVYLISFKASKMNLCDLEFYISLNSSLSTAGECSSCQNLPLTVLALTLLIDIMCVKGKPHMQQNDTVFLRHVMCSLRQWIAMILISIPQIISEINEKQFTAFPNRWPRLQRFYRQNECCDWLREYKTRHRVGIQIQRTVESISKRFFTEVVSSPFVIKNIIFTFFFLYIRGCDRMTKALSFICWIIVFNLSFTSAQVELKKKKSVIFHCGLTDLLSVAACLCKKIWAVYVPN